MSKLGQRYSLNTKQIHTLKLIYKFRVVTTALLASYKGISRISSFNSLKVLKAGGYLDNYFDKSYKLQGKGTYYYLTPAAIPVLKENGINPSGLKSIYNNKSLSPQTVDNHLDAFAVFLLLQKSYPDTFHIFAKTELIKYKYFPKDKPELYLNRIKHADATINEYLMCIYANSSFYPIKKRIDSYVEHYDSGEWETESETDYPSILIVCPNSKIEWQVRKYTSEKLDGMGIDELEVYTTTYKALRAGTKAIWSNVITPDVLVAL